MCKVSNELKLCTCSTKIDRLKHFWIFHRFSKLKNDIVIGLPMLPPFIDPADDAFNYTLLLGLLNDGDVFDIELNPIKKDRLLISIQTGPGDERANYGFQFNGSQWKKSFYDSLEWMWHHDEENYGKIKNALQK